MRDVRTDNEAAAGIGTAAENIRRWRERPDIMVRELFGAEPDPWQDKALRAFPTTPRIALQACTGPGKTAVLAWIGWNFLLTRPHPFIGATSISGDNLKANLWTELSRWQNRSELLQQAFVKTATVIYAKDHPETWRLEARTWAKDADPETIGKALKGLHADYVMWLLDETGDYPPAILPTVEAIFSGNPIEAHILQAGNPLKRTGVLFLACVRFAKNWLVIPITADPDDPNRTPRVSKEHAQQQIEAYGRDDAWVRANILGLFPLSDVNALIGEDEVRAAMLRTYTEHDIRAASRILGVDVAREGDDSSVIFRRQGLQCFLSQRMRGIDSVQGAGRVARIWQEWNADACFIDMTGGFGAGWYDQLVVLGRAPIGVKYSSEAHDKGRYYNKRAEMYFDAVSWIKRGGALPLPEGIRPEATELFQVLPQITYTFRGDRFLLEDKKQFKERIKVSPDETDAFVQTFAEAVTPAHRAMRRNAYQAQMEYDPFAAQAQPGRALADYDPFTGR